MPWLKHRLRDSDVWANVDAAGALVTDRDGRVEVVYKPVTGAKVYRASAKNLTAIPGEAALDIATGPEPIHVWTDGACQPNPGPAGLGVVIIDGAQRKELSEFLGTGTNNIAELTAILRGLESVEDKTRPVVVYSDSEYSIGVLTKAWKPKKNVELIAELRAVCR